MIATATVRQTVTSRQHLLPTQSSQVQRTPHTSASHNRTLTPCTWPVARHGSRDCSPHIDSTATWTSTCHMPHATCQQTCAEQKCCCNMQTVHPDAAARTHTRQNKCCCPGKPLQADKEPRDHRMVASAARVDTPQVRDRQGCTCHTTPARQHWAHWDCVPKTRKTRRAASSNKSCTTNPAP